MEKNERFLKKGDSIRANFWHNHEHVGAVYGKFTNFKTLYQFALIHIVNREKVKDIVINNLTTGNDLQYRVYEKEGKLKFRRV